MADSSVPTDSLKTITLGGGCFWCTEAIFQHVLGVVEVLPGYTGGSTSNPSRTLVGQGDTGHAESVRVTYDPNQISFQQLLYIFFQTHDPTTKDQQGADIGSQYRSVVFFESPEQERWTRQVIEELDANGHFMRPIVTTLEPLAPFFPAEPYHYDYFRRNPSQGYCQMMIAPKVMRLRAEFPTWCKPDEPPPAGPEYEI